MRKCLKKYSYLKDHGIYYLEKDNILYSIGAVKIVSNSKILIANDYWEISHSFSFPKLMRFFYKHNNIFIPNTFIKLQNENINLVRILVIKGKNIDIRIECNGRKESIENGEVINGVHIVNMNDLEGFLNEFNFEDQAKEFELSFK